MLISVPASTANLGPGFDALGLALDLPFRVRVGDSTGPEPDDLLAADEAHLLTKAYRAAGGRRSLWWRSPIPPGRGLGFSGAARVAGALAGFLDGGADEPDARRDALALACELEGHPDNAGASMLGGLTVSSGGHSVQVPAPVLAELRVVTWSPATETSTDASRGSLPSTVPFADAVFNVGRTALLVAALAAGDLDALSAATEDRLHSDRRLESVPQSAAALGEMRAAGALAAWLSGSGPTVAALVRADATQRVADALGGGGAVRVLGVDLAGARVEEG